MVLEVYTEMELALPRMNASQKEAQVLDLVLQGIFSLIIITIHIYSNMKLECSKTFSFGVCCVFLVTESGQTINQNCTYIRNPGFPSAYGDTSGVSYTINKCSSGTHLN